jgi:hypothetical protein
VTTDAQQLFSEPIDVYLANVWNDHCATGAKLTPETLWSPCQVLCKTGVVRGSDEFVAAIEVGPFRLVMLNSHAEYLRTFLVSSFPALVGVLASHFTTAVAAAEFVATAIHLWLVAAENTIMIKDDREWAALTYIKHQNSIGRFPTDQELTTVLFPGEPQMQSGSATSPLVVALITTLMDYPNHDHTQRRSLLKRRLDESLECLI